MLYLHIGRGKSGSSTLQAALVQNAAALKAQGFVLAAGSEGTRGNGVALAEALALPDRDEAMEAIARVCAAPAGHHVIASTEFLFDRPEEQVRLLCDALPDDTLIVVYVRSYAERLQSLYGHEVRKGRLRFDFDTYWHAAKHRASHRPSLDRWMSIFGRERVRVRHVDHVPGGIVGDFATVIHAALSVVADVNVAPHWLVTEFLREMFLAEPRPGTLARDDSGMSQVQRVVRKAIRTFDVPAAAYIASSAAELLDREYMADAEWLAETVGTPLPPPRGKRPARPFLPAFAAAPLRVRDVILHDILQSPDFESFDYLREAARKVRDKHLGRGAFGVAPVVGLGGARARVASGAGG